jgi:hypothetical protein
MPDRGFHELERQLLQGGIARAYVERTILELTAHCADLERDALAAGLSRAAAARAARTALGSERAISAAILARPELLAWSRRWPRVAACVSSVVFVGAMAEVPVIFCVHRATDILRWAIAGGLAVILVGSLGTVLNWMIRLP